ncbi:MAG: hypothetical protein C4532_06745 [Candidatus Abyssobacteria bacterium SURF_17]|jgi:hypothetical protein|uniref:Uncharacterized protein n=1 Tax=Candidatus Abyssobacteria bacterium SURF_17 TaxID=2093361 RepID=A0A419F196_9BACT|nr:MAG: hypothetical protein C4532_06745 [Candidatus Abyssubacteria bacterium SURF_17]
MSSCPHEWVPERDDGYFNLMRESPAIVAASHGAGPARICFIFRIAGQIHLPHLRSGKFAIVVDEREFIAEPAFNLLMAGKLH